MTPPRRDQVKRVPPPSTLLSKYSDASSSYWPPGWSFDRYVHATAEDSKALPDDERAKMQAGFRHVLGEDGVAEMARVVWQEQLRLKKLQEAENPSSSSPPQQQTPPLPDWLKTWSEYYQGQPWGFVVFRTALVSDVTDFTVEEFEKRVQEIVEIPFDAALEQGQPADLVARARSTFQLRWIDAEMVETSVDEQGRIVTHGMVAKLLRERYREMKESGTLPYGLSLPLFLCATPRTVTSVASTFSASDGKPETTSPRWRPNAPFLLAVIAETEQGIVDEEADDTVGNSERDWLKPTFKVAAEVLAEELWWVVERQITSLNKLTRFVREAKLIGDSFDEGGFKIDDVDDDQSGEPSGSDDVLDDIWWSVHMPPHRMRKRRRLRMNS